ncbi:VOC family protein [Shewanella sp. AS1]|uniref:VOC family protein n=1 Tax=Shewanella sp. AS1 TaxID=2907626 RepID=UPI001F2899C3|nr:VOC family protein [Shewanella sp. AS1]MCE9679491.1 VOC family protein [Shewanella sp. AS1]
MRTDTVTPESLQLSWPHFCQQILDFLQALGLDKLELKCDHVALRVNSSAAADNLSQHFATQGKLISNNLINGRPIQIFELNHPLILGRMRIECIELPYPGNKTYPIEGWEHIELILPGKAETTAQLQQQLLDALPSLAPILDKQTDIKVKHSSPKGEHERLANPTIALKRDNICIKIHAHGIKAIIASEIQPET